MDRHSPCRRVRAEQRAVCDACAAEEWLDIPAGECAAAGRAVIDVEMDAAEHRRNGDALDAAVNDGAVCRRNEEGESEHGGNIEH